MPKVINYTIQNPTLSQVTSISVSRQSDGQGGVQYILTTAYELVDNSTPAKVVGAGSVSKSLTAQQQSAIAAFINSLGVLGDIQVAEGL